MPTSRGYNTTIMSNTCKQLYKVQICNRLITGLCMHSTRSSNMPCYKYHYYLTPLLCSSVGTLHWATLHLCNDIFNRITYFILFYIFNSSLDTPVWLSINLVLIFVDIFFASFEKVWSLTLRKLGNKTINNSC